MKPRVRTPQEKKALRLAKDRRNTYAERGANCRFAIARHKAKDLRRIRRIQDAPLRALDGNSSEDELALAQLKAGAYPLRRWAKSPDSPLGEVIAHKHARRAAIAANGGRRKARG